MFHLTVAGYAQRISPADLLYLILILVSVNFDIPSKQTNLTGKSNFSREKH